MTLALINGRVLTGHGWQNNLAVLLEGEHIADLLHPLDVVPVQVVVMPESQREDQEREKHHAANERMQDARPLAAAQQRIKPRHGRMKHREA